MLCSDLSCSSIDEVLQHTNHYQYSPGALIYGGGSHHKFIYFIRLGMVKLESITHNGENRIVRLLGPGNSIGLELLDDVDFYNHNAVAVDRVDLCTVPIVKVKHLETCNLHLSRRIRGMLQSQLNLADQWIIALGTGTAKQRVAQLILILHQNFTDNNGAFVLLHRDDMAAMISITTETISRTIATFKRNNILFKTDDNLYKCDVSKIEEIARS